MHNQIKVFKDANLVEFCFFFQRCSDEVYQLMLLCWAAERNERPTFSQLEDVLRKMIDG